MSPSHLLAAVVAVVSTVAVTSCAAGPTARPHGWPGQLTHAAPAAPAMTLAPGVHLRRDNASFHHFTPAQVRDAYRQLRVDLAAVEAPSRLVDPTQQLTARQFQAVAGQRLSRTARAALAKIAPAALAGTTGAVETLRPLFFWYGPADVAAARQLRLAARPYLGYKLTDASATELDVAGRHAIAFGVHTELTLRLVDRHGDPNRLFLLRTLQAAMVPGPAGGPAWQIDAWTGSWQLVKPAGQKLPAGTPDTRRFQPGQ